MKFERVLTRGACLSNWSTIKYFGDDFIRMQFFNQQKVRADLFIDIVEGKVNRVPAGTMDRINKIPHNLGVYRQTEQLLWLEAKDPQLLIMDNYSELVDKRFDHPDGWSFCGLYGDIDEVALSEFTHKGLLNKEEIITRYDQIFKWVLDRWNIPIIFIHFPTVLDPREEYKEQGSSILSAMEPLAVKYGIQNITADNDAIEGLDGELYHYGPKTVGNLANKIRL